MLAMILFIQFTITDTRFFSDYRQELLSKPQWPSPKPFQEFVRSTGAVVERSKGGLSSWVGENFVCSIGNAIKYPKNLTFSNGVRISNISKHLYANKNYILTKYEFVFNLRLDALKGMISFNDIKTIVNELLASPVVIKLNGINTDFVIGQLPHALNKFHYQNTTIQKGVKVKNGQMNIMPCTPQCYFYLDKGEMPIKLDRNYKHIAKISNLAELFAGWHNHKNNPFRIWIHHRLKKSALIVENREIRMTIMRLHSEYECLRNLFAAISNGLITVEKRSFSSNELQSYFNFAIKTFLFEEKNLEFQSWTPNFFDYFSKIYAQASPGELEKISTRIKDFDFRSNIEKKVVNFIKKAKFVSKKKFVNNNSNIISQGDHNTIQGYQAIHSNDSIDYDTFLQEIMSVMEHAQKVAKSTDDFKSIAALSEAKDAAEQKNAGGVINALKASGKFAADIATRLTAGVMVELLKTHTTWI